MFSNKLTAILLPALLLLTLFLAFFLSLNTFINTAFVRRPLLSHLSDAYNCELRTDRLELSLWEGIGIRAINVEARSREGSDNIVASKMKVELDIKALLSGRIVPTRIDLFEPVIELTVKTGPHASESERASSIEDRIMQGWATLPPISLRHARLVLKDLSCAFEDLFLTVSHDRTHLGTFDVKARGKARFRQDTAPFTLDGTLSQDTETRHKVFAEITLKSVRVPLAWIPWPSTLPLEQGHAGIDVKVSGPRDGAFSIAGKFAIDDMRFTLRRSDRQNSFFLPRSVLSFESSYSESALRIPALHLEAPDFSLAAKSKLDFRQMHNPHVLLKVESPFMPLKTLKKIFPTSLVPKWIDNRLTPLLIGGDVRVDDFSLKGTWKQFQNLGQPENADALTMGLTWKNLSLRVDENSLPFENVAGELNIKNGTLLLSTLKADFGKSVLRRGALEVPNVFSDHDTYEIEIDGSFELPDLLRQKEMNLIPPKWLEKIPVAESVTGTLNAGTRIRFQNGWRDPRIVKGDFFFEQCRINDAALLFPLQVEAAEIHIGESGENQFKGKGLWGNSYVEATGSVEDFLKTRRADISARADMNELMGHFYPGMRSSIQFRDPLPCRISLSRLQNLWSFRGEAELGGMDVDTAALSINPKGQKNHITFDMDLKPLEKLRINRLYWVLGDSSLELSGLCNLEDKTLTDFEVITPSLQLEDLGLQFKKENLSADGSLKSHLTINTSLTKPWDTKIHGESEGENLVVTFPFMRPAIRKGRLKVKFAGKTAYIDSLNLEVGQNSIHVQGRLEGWDGLRGDLTVTTDHLHADDFAAERTEHLSGKEKTDLPGFLNRTDVAIKLNAARGQWGNFECGPLEAEGALRMGRLDINRSRIEMDGGLFTLNGYVNMGKAPEMAFSSYVNITDQPAEILPPLLRGMGIEAYLEGRLTMEAVLHMEGKNKAELFHSLAGGADVLLENGTVKKSNVIFKILNFLSLQKVLKRKPPDLSKEGFYFERIGGHIKMDDGFLHTSNLDMKSPVFNAAGKGSLELSTARVDFDLGVQPLGTVDSLVSLIPLAGYILTGEKKTLIVYHFKVEGTLPKPEVRYVPFRNLGGRIVDFFKRAFLTPGRLFEKLPKGSEAAAKKNELSPYEGP